MRRLVAVTGLLFVVCLAILCLAGCNKIASHGIPGDYVSTDKQGAHMVITADTIQADVGQLFFKVKYKTLSTNGENTTLEMDDGVSSKVRVTITQNGDTLTIRDNYVLNGTWKRK